MMLEKHLLSHSTLMGIFVNKVVIEEGKEISLWKNLLTTFLSHPHL